jgi:hypothetical protein
MGRRLHNIIDVLALLVFIALLFVPSISQSMHGSQIEAKGAAHRVVITAWAHRAH